MASQERLKPAPLAYEALSGLELLRLGPALPFLLREQKGQHEPVFIAPGFGADDLSTAPLRAYLRRMHYDAFGWDLGRNNGEVIRLVEASEQKIRELAETYEAPIHLIGWSLGGVICRALARRNPSQVAQVITMGTPVFGGPKHTATATMYERRGMDIEAVARMADENNRIPIRCPVTSIYTRQDGIVAWQASLDHVNPQAENIEVKTTHLGLGINKDVFQIIIRKLAEHT